MSGRSDDRALRKRMLIARAGLERIELGQQIAALRAATTTPRLVGESLSKLATRGGLFSAWNFLRRHPIASSAASILFARLRERLIPAAAPAARSAVKWAGLAVIGWQAWRYWKRHAPPRNEDLR